MNIGIKGFQNYFADHLRLYFLNPGSPFFENLVYFYLGQVILTLDLRDCKWNMPFSAYCLSVLPCLSFCLSFFLLIYISEFLVELFICILLKHAKIEVIYPITCICYEDAHEKVVTDRSYGLFLRSPLENQFSLGKWRRLSHQCKVTFDQISKSFAKRTTWNYIHEYIILYIILKLKVHKKVFTYK